MIVGIRNPEFGIRDSRIKTAFTAEDAENADRQICLGFEFWDLEFVCDLGFGICFGFRV